MTRLLARARPAPGASLIDVGCGTGALAARLGADGLRVLALDLRTEGIARLRAAGAPVLVACADATQLPVPGAVADVVLSLDVLEHVDDEVAIAEIARVLRPGGVAVLTVPALPWLWSARDDEAGHRRRYTRRTFESLMRRAGLDVVDLRFYQCLLLPTIALARLAGRLWPTTQRAEERPGTWVNRICLAINRFEVGVGDVVRWPLGSSLAAVARKARG